MNPNKGFLNENNEPLKLLIFLKSIDCIICIEKSKQFYL